MASSTDAVRVDIGLPQPAAASPLKTTRTASHKIANQILLYSFVAAVLLAISGFIVIVIYLFRYLNHAFAAFDTNSVSQLSGMKLQTMQTILLARAGLWKFILQSCGIITGAVFGFLGFALFLLGIKGDMDASFDDSQHKVQLSRLAPGSFVLLIAAVLIGMCSIHQVELIFNPETVIVPKQVQTPSQPTSVQSNPSFNPNDPTQNPNATYSDSSGDRGSNAQSSSSVGSTGAVKKGKQK